MSVKDQILEIFAENEMTYTAVENLLGEIHTDIQKAKIKAASNIVFEN